MKFIKVETGLGGWVQVDDQGNVIQHLTNHQHHQIVQQMVDARAHDWFNHLSAWITNEDMIGGNVDLMYLVHSIFN